MDLNNLQSLVGSLSFGLHATEAVPALKVPAASLEKPKISMIGPDGHEHVVFDGNNETTTACSVETNEYHVLYLLGGQVYFGRLRVGHERRTISLDDTHYLVPSRSGHSSLQLIRVGQELHAPLGEVTLNMTYVISWQELSPTSPLMAAICNGRALFDEPAKT